MFKRLLQFYVYSNLFIAACAVLMVYQAGWLLLGEDPPCFLTGFVLFSTICSYSFHWYLSSGSVIPSERIQWLKKYRFIHIILFITGLVGVGFFFYHLREYWFWLLLSAFATFLYSAPKIPHPLFRLLRKVAIGKTIFLAFVWMYVTSVLPVMVTNAAWNTGFTLFAISRFFLIYAICILFDYRDRQDDKAAGVRSLITYLGEKSITGLFYFSILVFFASTLLLLNYNYRLLPVILLLIPGVITAALYDYARKNFGDMFYYFVLDGLMAFSALLMLVFSYFRIS
ncbi:MAG: UbiA family prenyltransferase [Chitinophagaceae bacterium]|nr:UbiA family prenyltransferase [Chitinophagaceae bacterium]